MGEHADGLTDRELLGVLDNTRRIAVIGASSDPSRASYGVMRYLSAAGFVVSGVNPGIAGEDVAGIRVFASLAEVPGPVDLVDVFRREDALPAVTDDVLSSAADKDIRFLWFQLGLVDHDSAERARDAGLTVIMDRCLKIEHARFMPK
jgi:predicted CoA-binding protein